MVQIPSSASEGREQVVMDQNPEIAQEKNSLLKRITTAFAGLSLAVAAQPALAQDQEATEATVAEAPAAETTEVAPAETEVAPTEGGEDVDALFADAFGDLDERVEKAEAEADSVAERVAQNEEDIAALEERVAAAEAQRLASEQELADSEERLADSEILLAAVSKVAETDQPNN